MLGSSSVFANNDLGHWQSIHIWVSCLINLAFKVIPCFPSTSLWKLCIKYRFYISVTFMLYIVPTLSEVYISHGMPLNSFVTSSSNNFFSFSSSDLEKNWCLRLKNVNTVKNILSITYGLACKWFSIMQSALVYSRCYCSNGSSQIFILLPHNKCTPQLNYTGHPSAYKLFS